MLFQVVPQRACFQLLFRVQAGIALWVDQAPRSRRRHPEVFLSTVRSHQGALCECVRIAAYCPVVTIHTHLGITVKIVTERKTFGQGVMVGGDVDVANLPPRHQTGAFGLGEAHFAKTCQAGSPVH